MRTGIITIIAAALLLPLATLAQPGPGGGPGCGPGMGMGDGPFLPDRQNHMMRRGGPGCDGPDGSRMGNILAMADELGLTEQQREQFKQMRTDFRMQMIDKEAAVEKAEVQLRSAMAGGEGSAAEVGRMIDEVARLRADIQKARYSHRQQMKGVLTAEQVKKLETIRQERREERQESGQGLGQRRGHRMGGRR